VFDPSKYCGPEPCSKDGLKKNGFDLLEALRPVDLKGCTTHCWELMRSFPRDTKDFTRADIHYEADGLHLTYFCTIDGRRYSVFIKPEK
jgi:hypothetical protein